MARTGRPKTELTLTEQEGEQLVRWSHRAKSSQALALRSKIVLACAKGTDNKDVAAQLNCAVATVGKWRSRFVAERLDGLVDEPRPGRPATISVEAVEAVVVATLEETPRNATHWSRASMAKRSGLSKTTIGRIWKAFELKPHRVDGFKLSSDPLFVEKVYDDEGPGDLEVHLVCDNYGTHKTPAINAWLAKHPRFHMHNTATSSSWINQV